ncbi:MAG: SH3 domain-containing protein [Candidatus Omnitrophota bacterium]
MRRYTLLIAAFLFIGPAAIAADGGKEDPGRLFYAANVLYEKGEYSKAVEEYLKILDADIESGNLYYNIGNGFFKLGKIGYAILSYEKAKRFMPGDRDLKANLEYARSFVEDGSSEPRPERLLLRAVNGPFRSFNLRTLAIAAIALNVIFVILSVLNIMKPSFYRKTFIFYFAVAALFFAALASFVLRHYDEALTQHGIVVDKTAECMYEPVEKSTVYYKVYEGQDVIVLTTRNGWRRIRRSDGKVGWVKEAAVEEI